MFTRTTIGFFFQVGLTHPASSHILSFNIHLHIVPTCKAAPPKYEKWSTGLASNISHKRGKLSPTAVIFF
jgi:hypothetical protein